MSAAESARRNRARKRGETNKYLRDLKSNTPCADCGQFFHWCIMEFDHTDGSKVCSPHQYNNKAMLDELAKCDIVCANCHNMRTFKRAGWLVE